MRIKILVLSLLLVLMHASSLSAHVLVTEEAGKSGAILHLSHGDEPIAGETTGIYFDITSTVDLQTSDNTLLITSKEGGIAESIPLSANGQSLSGAFIFPIRDAYKMILTITPRDDATHAAPLMFDYSVNVSSSADKSDPAPQVPLWARIGVVLSAWAIAGLIALAIRRRQRIAEHST